MRHSYTTHCASPAVDVIYTYTSHPMIHSFFFFFEGNPMIHSYAARRDT